MHTFGFLLFISLVVTTVVLVKAGNTTSDRNALLAFRRGVLDEEKVLESWDSDTVNICTWFHITCDDNKRVIRLDLGGSHLLGNLSSELGNLDRLNYLELYNNNLSGPIPQELGNLVNLKFFDLFNNRFSGTILQSLGKLSLLSFIRFNNNHLTGSIPGELGNIPTLKIVDVSNNQLCGSVPRGGSLSKVKTYNYGNNPGIDKPC